MYVNLRSKYEMVEKTAEEKRRENAESNYYLILELDFEKPETSKAVIEKAFVKKSSEWGKEHSVDADRNRDNVGDRTSFKRVMMNDDPNSIERIAEANAAKAISQKKENEIIDILSKKIHISLADLESLINSKEYKKYRLNKDKIKNALGSIVISAKSESSSFGEVERHLRLIGKKNIYEYMIWVYVDCEISNKKSWTKEEILQLSNDELKKNKQIKDFTIQKTPPKPKLLIIQPQKIHLKPSPNVALQFLAHNEVSKH